MCPTPARHVARPTLCVSGLCHRLPRAGLGATQTTTDPVRDRRLKFPYPHSLGTLVGVTSGVSGPHSRTHTHTHTTSFHGPDRGAWHAPRMGGGGGSTDATSLPSHLTQCGCDYCYCSVHVSFPQFECLPCTSPSEGRPPPPSHPTAAPCPAQQSAQFTLPRTRSQCTTQYRTNSECALGALLSEPSSGPATQTAAQARARH